jgi:hypothetical protein
VYRLNGVRIDINYHSSPTNLAIATREKVSAAAFEFN